MSCIPDPMDLIDLPALGVSISLKRQGRNYRELKSETGLNPISLSRAEHWKKIPLEEFLLLCKWLERDPKDFVRQDYWIV
jgi:DNA-binding Xre family transcriptional regulator